MNGDSEHQESTEERTEQIIRNSTKIMQLLAKDKIKVEEVSDYHLYPIADNDTPRLSADRFEYTFSNGLFLYGAWNLNTISKYYNDIQILKNEDNTIELGFKTLQICKDYLKNILPIFANYDDDKTRAVMQFFADIVKSMNVLKLISIDDLYEKSEKEIVDIILNCKDNYIKKSFQNFLNATTFYASEIENGKNYCVSVKAKKRYIVPLVKVNNKALRIDEVDEDSKEEVENYKNLKRSKYIGFNFSFKSY